MNRRIAAAFAILCLSGCSVTHSKVVNINLPPPAVRPAKLVADQMRVIRVAEETAAIASTGHPQILATGICSAVITLTASGMVAGTPLMQCENPALAADFLKAIFAAEPFIPRPGYDQLHIGVGTFDMEPGVGEPAGA